MRTLTIHLPTLALVVLLSACASDGIEPPRYADNSGYSPNYTHITVVDENGRSRRALAADACLGASEADPSDEGAERLPPGCANNYNLQRMVADKKDLKRGRKLGPAPAYPAARAAGRYIDGENPPARGGGFTPGASSEPNMAPVNAAQ